MNVKLLGYQKDCVENVINKIESGATRLSVAITIGLGKLYTSLFLAEELTNRYQEDCVLLFERLAECKIAKEELLRRRMSDRIKCVGLGEFLHEQNCGFKYCIIFNFSPYSRKEMLDVAKGKNIVIISFFSPEQEAFDNFMLGNDPSDKFKPLSERFHPNVEEQRKFAQELPPVVSIYETKNVLDVRDIRYADGLETNFIKSEISVELERLTNETTSLFSDEQEFRKQTSQLIFEANVQIVEQKRKIEDLETQITQLKETCRLIKSQDIELAKQKIVIKQLEMQLDELERKYQLITIDKNNSIAEQKRKIDELEIQGKEKDERFVQLERMISFCFDILNAVGISPEKIKQQFDLIQKYRKSLGNNSEMHDQNAKEKALKSFQDGVVEGLTKNIKNIISLGDRIYYEKMLIGELTQSVWNKLNKDSQTFLITAKITFDSMSKMPNSDSLDYSGVCLLVTKALEIETTKRFFTGYKNFLAAKCSAKERWPEGLYVMKRGERKIMSDNDFTLGSAVHVVGYKRKNKGNEATLSQQFLEYAAKELFIFSDEQKVKKEMENDLSFIEKVRVDYRNPSAHKKAMASTTAKKCLEYVLDVQKMLKKMLQAMKV